MLHDSVIERCGTDIVTGVLPAGYRIGTDEAAARLGVSRTVVREAVRVLESMGLVTVRQRVGITVAPEDQWSPFDARILRWRLAGPDAHRHLQDLAELRMETEPLAARLAARHATAEQGAALTAAVAAMATAARSADWPALAAWDAEFHRTVLTASGNRLMMGLGPIVADAITAQVTPDQTIDSCSDPAMIHVHGTVAAAIQAGEPEAAERAMRTITGVGRATAATAVDRRTAA